MSNLVINPNKGSGGLVKSVHITPMVELADNKRVGMSQDDGSNNAQGTLYPTSLSTTLTSQTQITSLYSTNPAAFYVEDDEQYDAAESKLKIGEAFFSKYKKLLGLIYSAFTATARLIPTSAFTFYDIFKVVWLDANRFAVLYEDDTSGFVMKLVIGKVGTDGIVTWGTPASVKTWTDATHKNYALGGMDITDTDKLLIHYTNKVSTNYWLKARVAVITDQTIALQSESSDLLNFGTSTQYKTNSVKIRGSAGAGAIAVITPLASGTTTLNNVSVLAHDAANAVTAGTATVATPSSPTDGGLSLYSYATDRLIVMSKQSGSNHLYARLYSFSGTTATALGAGATQITTSTGTYYLPNKGQYNFMNFGSNILGFLWSTSGSTSTWYVGTLSVASDTLTLIDQGTATESQINISSTTELAAVTLADNTGLVYTNHNLSGDKMTTVRVVYLAGKAKVTTYTRLYNDNEQDMLSYTYPSAAKTALFSTNANYNQAATIQIGAGDSTIQILDRNDNVAATITEVNDGAYSKVKMLNLTTAAIIGKRLQFKIKNNGSQARIIRLQKVLAEVE